MLGALSVGVVAMVIAVVCTAGAINGVAGFGFALVGTMALATVTDPAVAVVFMIVPILAVNASLLGELSAPELRRCGRRFWPLLAAALFGTVVGMAVLERLPEAPLRVALGIVTLGFVLHAQPLVAIPGATRVTDGCFVETPLAMGGVGVVAGALFGGTNVGVQLVAYLRSCGLSHSLFVGVVAMLFVGINGVRVAVAGAFGLYPSGAVVAASVGAAVPAVAGVAVGKQLRGRITGPQRQAAVLGLLTVIGIRLILGGVGVV